MKYVKQLLIGLDQLFNAILGGWADETISSRAYRQNHKTHWLIIEALINSLFFWQSEHCKQSYEAEKNRRHQPPELRK